MGLPDGFSTRWNDPADVADAATFAGAVIGQSPEYISHGEIQTGLSDDGKHWIDNLAARYAEDFADPGERDMLVARAADGSVCGVLIVAWKDNDPRKFAVIEDMAVDPACRSQGIGQQLMALAEERIRQRGVEWVFLESGLRNEHAHRFFEREGFHPVSHVFARRLEP